MLNDSTDIESPPQQKKKMIKKYGFIYLILIRNLPTVNYFIDVNKIFQNNFQTYGGRPLPLGPYEYEGGSPICNYF